MSVAPETVHRLTDLDSWPPGDIAWPDDGVALAVVGHPVAHSLSPVMHNTALAALARTDASFAQWRYFKFDIAPAELGAALQKFHRNKFHGLNLTVPHKTLAVEQLASRDAFVNDAGAANTLRRTAQGWHGDNTDGVGLTVALREDLSVELRQRPVILLGAGGAARGAAVECLRQGCASLSIGNRTVANRDSLIARLRTLAGKIPIHGFDPSQPSGHLPPDSVLINATSAGLKPDDPAPIDLRRLPGGLKVFDMIYNPPATPLLRQAAGLGLAHANGLSMLVHQGVRSLEIWTGKKLSADIVAAMKSAARDGLTAR